MTASRDELIESWQEQLQEDLAEKAALSEKAALAQRTFPLPTTEELIGLARQRGVILLRISLVRRIIVVLTDPQRDLAGEIERNLELAGLLVRMAMLGREDAP